MAAATWAPDVWTRFTNSSFAFPEQVAVAAPHLSGAGPSLHWKWLFHHKVGIDKADI
jgi:hypothetical protein